MKKIVAVILAAMLAMMSITACGDKQDPSENSGGSAEAGEQDDAYVSSYTLFPMPDGAYVGDTMPYYEDGKMNSRCKRILDVLELNEDAVGLELLSSEIRKRAALEKGFEGALTDLQMHSFLLMNDFRRRRNKQGAEYGWHVATLMTPETKWGRSYVTGCYTEDPKDSWQKIKAVMAEKYPEAGDDMITKLLGIRQSD